MNTVKAGTAFQAAAVVEPDVPHPWWTLERVAAVLETGPSSPRRLAGISTDSRSIRRGDLFVALRGDHHDAHDFLADACTAGAAALVVSDAAKAIGLGVPVYVVSDTLQALGKLGTAWRHAWGGLGRTVVAIAGSNGKTSTKELVRAALGKTFSVHATAGNFNNLIGVPLTLLAIPASADIAVVEVGTNAPGEIARLREMVAPDIAVVTSIGEEHLEGLGDIDGVLKEECSVFDGVSLGVIPSAFGRACEMAHEKAGELVTVSLGDPDLQLERDGAAAMTGSNIHDRVSARLQPDRWGIDAEGRPWLEFGGEYGILPVHGAHQATNAMLALAVARACGVSARDALKGMAAMETVPRMRTEFIRLGSATVINDAYNSNPPSALAALALLVHAGEGRQRVAFLGTMRELGRESDSRHDAVAAAALNSPVELIVAIGEFAGSFMRLVRSGRVSADDVTARVVSADDPETAWRLAESRIARDATILLKASRGLKLERLLPQISSWSAV